MIGCAVGQYGLNAADQSGQANRVFYNSCMEHRCAEKGNLGFEVRLEPNVMR